MVLEKINQPNDIKSLTDEELKILASEIREFLIEKISVTGGHLASNLGVVELTMALHLALDIPKDKINEACNKIKNGDIILITTHIKGLDTSHLGFAWKNEGKTYLLHASSKGKQVMISSLPLQEYMEGIDSQSGIMLARAAKTLAE